MAQGAAEDDTFDAKARRQQDGDLSRDDMEPRSLIRQFLHALPMDTPIRVLADEVDDAGSQRTTGDSRGLQPPRVKTGH